MSPLPKRKFSKGRTRRKRNGHYKLAVVSTVVCKNCKAEKLSHKACPNCGKN